MNKLKNMLSSPARIAVFALEVTLTETTASAYMRSSSEPEVTTMIMS